MGHASIMKDFINSDANVISDEEDSAASVLLDRAETLLHDNYGDSFYWMARRSMVFSSNLRAVGDSFRAKFLQSNDEDDGTILDPDWTKNERKPGIAEGGPYLAIHLRYESLARSIITFHILNAMRFNDVSCCSGERITSTPDQRKCPL